MALSQIKWADSLPYKPQVSGYKETPGRSIITSDFDVGPKRQRKRSSAAMRKVSATYYLKMSQKDEWDSFYELAVGRSFWWRDPLKNYEYVYARFAEDPSITPKGPAWFALQVELEIWAYITQDDMALPDTSTETSGSDTSGTDSSETTSQTETTE